MGTRRQNKTEEQPTAAEQNPVTNDEGNLPEQTGDGPPTTTPTDPETAQAVADATAADAAETQPDVAPPPSDVAAGSDGGPKIEGPTPAPADAVDVGEPSLTERDHAKGCPANRLEAYPATRPDGSTVKVSHCIDCGASVVDD